LNHAFSAETDRFVVDELLVFAKLANKFDDAVLVIKFLLLLRVLALVDEHDAHARVEEGEFAHAVREVVEFKLYPRRKNGRVREKGYFRSGAVRIGEITDHGELFCRDAAFEGDMVDLAVAVDVGGEPVGESVDTFGPDPVETT